MSVRGKISGLLFLLYLGEIFTALGYCIMTHNTISIKTVKLLVFIVIITGVIIDYIIYRLTYPKKKKGK